MFRAPLLRSLPRVGWTGLTAAGLVLTAFATRAVTDPSPWLHLKVGQFLLDGHRFAAPDPFAPYASSVYEPTQWLPSVVVAALYDHAGLPAVAWARGAGIACFALAMVLATRLAARPALALAASVLTVACAYPSLTERPQLLGFIMVVVTVCAWWRSAHDGRARWWLIPFTWLAACVHGVWAVGVGLGALVVAGIVLQRLFSPRDRNRLIMVLAGCVVAAGLTPLGPRLVVSPFSVGGNARQFVTEWMASSVRTPSVALSLLVLGAVFALWVTSRRQPPYWQVMLWVAAILLVLVMQRTVGIGAIVGAMLLADAAENHLARRAPTAPSPVHRTAAGARAAELGVLLSATLVAVLLAIPLAATGAQAARGVPTALTQPLRQLPQGTHVISDGDLSGWLMFQAPQLRPVFDIRVEVYSAAHIRGFIDALSAEPGWTAYLGHAQTRAALLKADAPLVSALGNQWHWTVVASDRGYVLMEPR